MTARRPLLALATSLLASIASTEPSAEGPSPDESVTILSWNISGDAFESARAEFDAILRWARPDIILLDEVSPSASLDVLSDSLGRLTPGTRWQIQRSESGGRQRAVIASTFDLDPAAAFGGIVEYDAATRDAILRTMSDGERSNPKFALDAGLAVAAAFVAAPGGRLLVLSVDFECCGDGPASWPEVRRRAEARMLRQRIRQVLGNGDIDGVVLAGDFNLVESTFAMSIIAGPYPRPVAGLIPAELYHPDGASTWTWDGRGTPFPSDVLDFQFYSAAQLRVVRGGVLDVESLPTADIEALGLTAESLKRTGRHRPLLVEYAWH